MPTNRFNYSDDFVLNNGKVGINSASPQEKLDVVGIVKGDNLKVTGVSSFTTYEGFLNSNHNITENITLTSGTSGSLSGEIIVGTGITLSGISSTTSGQGHIDSLKVYNTLTIPVGGTLERPSKANPGQLYYNKDFASIEFYDGDRWRQVDNTTQRGRGVFGGGATTTGTQVDFVNISTLGNALDFGVLNEKTEYMASCSSSTRGLWGGGRNPTSINSIQYLTIASTGNAQDFGDLTTARLSVGGCSSSTRGIFAGGEPAPYFNVIDYVQISTIGNALDFGDLTSSRGPSNGLSSSTRGIFGGGATPSIVKTIDSITISSTGNAVKFGDLITSSEVYCSSNSTRGIFFHSEGTISYITLSSFGNSVDFGDCTVSRFNASSCSSSTRGIFAGGRTPTIQNVIDYVTIASTGNAQDFGDLTFARHALAACSDSHGGLGGF